MTSFVAHLRAQYPDASLTRLSDSNNDVYLVRQGESCTIAKQVTDSDIPLLYHAEANEALADALDVQRIRRVCLLERGDPFDAVFADYVEGVDLATALPSGQAPVEPQALVDFLRRFVLTCRRLPRLRPGFTMYKRDAPTFAEHADFVVHYASRYWSRVRPSYQGGHVAAAVDDWLSGGLAEALNRHPASFDVVAIDANLKNFVVANDGSLTVLNVPIAALSTPAQAVGAVGVHLRGSALHDRWLEVARAELCPDDHQLVPHFELFSVLGIMSFHAVRDPGRHAEWRNWGSDVPLDVSLRDLVDNHVSQSVAL